MFQDEATLEVVGGHGGRGCISWRREKFEPMGGPDGGEGGRGGNVILIADENTDTLSDYVSRKRFAAEKGRFGSGQNRSGKSGEDLVLPVPPGTLIYDVTGEKSLIADLATHGDQLIVARGGRGGFGNAHFKSATRQSPDFAELGEPGENRKIHMELKLVADAGIIGYPSVGKSSLIAAVSSARPKIADYPFTTLVPNLGVVRTADRSFILCDIPGLIEGASEGKGLGHTFLRHIERCGILLHVLDSSRGDADALVKDYKTIREELAKFSNVLADKKELVILNKSDLLAHDTSEIEKELRKRGIAVSASVSAATRHGTEGLMKKLLPIVLEERKHRIALQDAEEEQRPIPVLRPQEDSLRMSAFRMERDGNVLRIRGKRIEQFTSMTDFGNPGAVRRFLDVLEKVGLKKLLKKEIKPDTEVYIGKIRIDQILTDSFSA